jgi:putative transferase (TIGR04331 family)
LKSDATAGSVRASIALRRRPANRFESFLHGRIGSELPQVFVELFASVGRFCEMIRVNPKVIFTANDHANNDLFKRWAAQKVHEGIPLVIMEHGSGIPALFSSMECEEEIADVKITWSKPYHSKHVRLPANKLAGRRRHAGTPWNRRLLVVGQEMPRYAFDALSMPIGAQTLTGFDFICSLHDRLNAEPQRAFLVKPYPNLGWRTRDRFSARLGKDKVSTEANLDRLMRRSRMIVCTYPQTTFSEALTSGVPTVLVYAKHYWETVASFDELIRILCDARIVFFDPADAADHINAVWEDPMNWWRSSEVTQALQEYATEAADVRRDWVKPWTTFMRRMLTEPNDSPAITVPIGEADE